MPTAVSKRSTHLNVLATEREKQLLEAAASAAHLSVSAFVLRAAAVEAENLLANRTVFQLPPDKWEAFVAALDQPPREKQELRALLQGKDVFSVE